MSSKIVLKKNYMTTLSKKSKYVNILHNSEKCLRERITAALTEHVHAQYFSKNMLIWKTKILKTVKMGSKSAIPMSVQIPQLNLPDKQIQVINIIYVSITAAIFFF